MGRRVLTVYELSFHEKRKRNAASFTPADLDGEDLLDIFQTWVAGLTTAETHNKGRQTWVSVDDVSLYAPRVLLLDLRVGAYGEAGELVDVDTGEPVGTIADNQAPTVPSSSFRRRASGRTSCRRNLPAARLADASETCSAPTSAATPTR